VLFSLCWGNYFIIFYYIANDIACGSNGHRREFNVELALILGTENLENFQNTTRIRRTLTSSNGRGSFDAYGVRGCGSVMPARERSVATLTLHAFVLINPLFFLLKKRIFFTFLIFKATYF
jgi:hypothetical protein